VTARPGKPAARDSRFSNPSLALGPPDDVNQLLKPQEPASITLGCTGEVVLRFTDNVLVDVPGPDLYVFEVGPAIEATHLAISASWIAVGVVRGGTAQVDIAKVAAPGTSYRYVRRVDPRRAAAAPGRGRPTTPRRTASETGEWRSCWTPRRSRDSSIAGERGTPLASLASQ
jgi:hypothetical protein